MSYIEKTARKLYPILIELKKRMVPEKKRIQSTNKNKNNVSRGANNSMLIIDPIEEGNSSDEQLLIDLTSDRHGGK